jgi:hypothetical protein
MDKESKARRQQGTAASGETLQSALVKRVSRKWCLTARILYHGRVKNGEGAREGGLKFLEEDTFGSNTLRTRSDERVVLLTVVLNGKADVYSSSRRKVVVGDGNGMSASDLAKHPSSRCNP